MKLNMGNRELGAQLTVKLLFYNWVVFLCNFFKNMFLPIDWSSKVTRWTLWSNAITRKCVGSVAAWISIFFSPSLLRKEETCCEWREMQSANVPWYIYRDPLCATDIPRALHNPNGMCWPHKTGTIYFSSMRPSSSSLTLIVIWFHFPLFFFFHQNIYGTFCWTKESFCCHQVVRSDVQSPHRLTTPNRINVLTVSLFRWGFLFMRLD